MTHACTISISAAVSRPFTSTIPLLWYAIILFRTFHSLSLSISICVVFYHTYTYSPCHTHTHTHSHNDDTDTCTNSYAHTFFGGWKKARQQCFHQFFFAMLRLLVWFERVFGLFSTTAKAMSFHLKSFSPLCMPFILCVRFFLLLFFRSLDFIAFSTPMFVDRYFVRYWMCVRVTSVNVSC